MVKLESSISAESYGYYVESDEGVPVVKSESCVGYDSAGYIWKYFGYLC